MKTKMMMLSILMLATGLLSACGAQSSVPEPLAILNEPAVLATSVVDPAAAPLDESTQAAAGASAAAESAPAVSAEVSAAAAASGLSEAEAAGLLYMREEEKLAQDVYLALFDRWGLQVFQNIAGSEASHTASVQALLSQYGLPDPAAQAAAGVFANPELQSLYDGLVEQGSSSLEAAIRVGAAIEEIDILDLQEQLALTDHPDIQRVYENLLRGSENHLRAFVNTLQNQVGAVYQPQYLDAETYQAILAGTSGRYGQGNGRGGQNGNGSGGGSTNP